MGSLDFTLKDAIVFTASILGSLWASFVCARYIEFRQVIRTAMTDITMATKQLLGGSYPNEEHSLLVRLLGYYGALWDQGQRRRASDIYSHFVSHISMLRDFDQKLKKVPKADPVAWLQQANELFDTIKTSMAKTGNSVYELKPQLIWLLLGGLGARLLVGKGGKEADLK